MRSSVRALEKEGTGFDDEEFDESFEENWTAFIAGLGECFLERNTGVSAITKTLAKLIFDAFTSHDDLRTCKTENRFHSYFDNILPKRLGSTIYKELVRAEIPKRTFEYY